MFGSFHASHLVTPRGANRVAAAVANAPKSAASFGLREHVFGGKLDCGISGPRRSAPHREHHLERIGLRDVEQPVVLCPLICGVPRI